MSDEAQHRPDWSPGGPAHELAAVTAEPRRSAEDELKRLRRRVAELEHALETDCAHRRHQLELAAEVHRTLLPRPVHHPQIQIDVRYLPIEEVGGDYCQVRFSDRDTCYVAICDVTGHGLGPALLATRVSSEVRYGILYGRPPRDIVRALNYFICSHFSETGLYLSFFVARIDLPRRQVTWSGAGHPGPLWVRRHDSTVEPLPSQSMLVGISLEALADPPEQSQELQPGDRLVFYTDGLTETADAQGRQLGVAGLAEAAVASMSLDPFDTADWLLDGVARHQHGPSTDDKTLIVVELS
jgi:sigma-B regulation protein RsbU (phosphoserine phosphatase)